MMAASNVNSNHSSAPLSKSNANFTPKTNEQTNAMDIEQLQHMINCTVKKNPKAELSKSDLLRLLGYLEGELQARDVVIATLKAERVKQQVSHARYGRILPVNDPFIALQRDSRSATVGGSSTDDTALLKAVTEGPMAALEALVVQHRNSHVNLIQAMQDAEARHSQELEVEKQSKKKLEKDIKKLQETLDEERQRQKQIVLLLLTERKKLILKYVEERNKSEDLAQILGEEKGRVDTMAEGLEEESQKALQMEAELEKQLALFDTERAQLKAQLQREEKRTKELELVIEKLHTEVDNLKKQQAEAHQVAMFQAGLNQPNSPPRITTTNRNSLPSGTSTLISPAGSITMGPQLPSKPAIVPPQTPPRSVNSTIVSSSPVSISRTSPSASIPLNSATGLVVLGTTGKVVQPMALVSSTPVQAPTTGIARAVSPSAGGIRNVQYNLGGMAAVNTSPSGSSRTLPPPPVSTAATSNDTVDVTPASRGTSVGTMQISPRVAVSASAGTKVFTTTNNEGKVTFHVTTSATLPTSTSVGTTGTAISAQPTTPKKSAAIARGVPPPVPPNKPVIPPKKSSTATAMSMASSSVSGQIINPCGVVISCSNNPQVTTVDHGRPISLEVHPLHKAGQIGSHQGVKFGITISKDKIQISSNPSEQGLADQEVREAIVQVGDGVDGSGGSQSPGHEISEDSSSRSPLTPLCLALLEKELDDFQQLLSSMATPTSSFAPSSLLSSGSTGLTSSTASSAPAEESSGVMLHMGV
ncbi:CTTNBP2 N-terminal-like protein isoform X2 [Daphnia magna]|uniref:CTTNBP2 N-terminal-like protein isoform X2 n=1 Tax=Daphnia magna TaxID=35525 RepID=UPI0006DF5FE9|nr:CTTNBP2 N-terminal-like protein isoform X2 [Daphnia magna]